jgi:hypothetical protein
LGAKDTDMKSDIHAITLNLDHPEYKKVWIVDNNCDEIKLGFSLGKIWYQPIVDGVSRGCYWAEQIEKVYYKDKSIVKFEQKVT